MNAAAIRRVALVMVDARTAVAHLVTDEAMAAGRRAGRYTAACRTVVLAGSLTQDSDDYCRSCAAWAAQR